MGRFLTGANSYRWYKWEMRVSQLVKAVCYLLKRYLAREKFLECLMSSAEYRFVTVFKMELGGVSRGKRKVRAVRRREHQPRVARRVKRKGRRLQRHRVLKPQNRLRGLSIRVVSNGLTSTKVTDSSPQMMVVEMFLFTRLRISLATMHGQ
ncbi:hypothetical protein BSL78_19163 [Apostichopus japonicus]|uniref:Uncharacterized protein n=1 Tax=Stichopus japonicus TaxID=307972 RepID=A0A2G8K7N2_STIJA|nr:hypothetical protein BSL78_19163 [Apostichopus japonicus]